MSQLTATQQPSANEESASIVDKRTMSRPGSRSASVTQRNRTPTNQSARSSVHGDNVSNTGEDGSTVNKPIVNSARRTPAKSTAYPISQKRPSSNLPAASPHKSDFQHSFKKKRYLELKKRLLGKQKEAQVLYNDMSQLYEKLSMEGAKDLDKPEELKLFSASPKQLLSSEANAQNEQTVMRIEKLPIGKEILDSLESRLRELPRKSQELCQELLRKQSSFVDFVTSHLIKASEDLKGTDISIVTEQLETQQREHTTFVSRLKEFEELEEKSVGEVIKNVADMVDEFEASRAKLIELNAADAHRELQRQLNTATEEMQVEKERNMQSKDRIRQTETALQKARLKIKQLETYSHNDEEKIQQMQANEKTLQGQMKQKEGAMENKMKEMQKVLKNSEDLIAKVEKQRDSFEARVVELKKIMTTKENEELMRIKELSDRLNLATNEIGMERQKRLQVEDACAELEERCKSLEEKSKQLCELTEENNDFLLIDSHYTETEMRLFNELRATRNELESQRQEILQLQQEKNEIVAVMHQAASREEDKDSREKLAAELVLKSTELQKLMMEHSNLKKVTKNVQEKNGNLEKHLTEIQTRLQSQSMEGGNAGLSAHVIELQQQVSDLHSNLADVIQQKDELQTALSQKQLELEQLGHVMRQQSKVLKAREELLDILKGKVEQENEELMNNGENNEYLKQIAAKTEALQELYTLLKNKQMQIMHLENMVKMLEVQQDRAQAQRTRLENRIAQLELNLHRGKEQRNKGFGIL